MRLFFLFWLKLLKRVVFSFPISTPLSYNLEYKNVTTQPSGQISGKIWSNKILNKATTTTTTILNGENLKTNALALSLRTKKCLFQYHRVTLESGKKINEKQFIFIFCLCFIQVQKLLPNFSRNFLIKKMSFFAIDFFVTEICH